ncbi:MAG: hypothetical protein K2N56_10520, partial [Oscillospiraceae bacterium]|nr:hypothetical protein [Oscillospiraceae bacterium]
MNIKKITVFSLSALFAVSLCGCGGSEGSNNGSTTATNNSTSNHTGSTPVYPVPSDATFLKGAAGDIIGLSEITGVWDLENREISPESMTEENFFK